ncbi:hypothetical protein [Paenibacillus tundrae]|uniref:hypothetical protein n=1 Tax=Paenibacillus tundrae TaxID=528187 RepID=UPI0030CFB700
MSDQQSMESIKFSRSVALGRFLIALSAVLFGIFLILAPEQGEFGWFAPLYYVLIFVLSIWFVGPALCKLTVLLFARTTLISFDQYRVTARDGRSLPWSKIKRIEVVEDTINNIAQPVPRLYRFTLLDRSHVDMSTYHLLTNQQFTDGAKKLRTAWSHNKHRKVDQ